MNFQIKSLFIITFILCSSIISKAQTIGKQLTLKEKIAGIEDFATIQRIANDHYSEMKKNGNQRIMGDMKEKHWRRQEWNMSKLLDKDGKVFDNARHNMNVEASIRKQEQSISQTRNSGWFFTAPDGHISNPTQIGYIGLGRVDRMAFHPTDPDIIYIGTPFGGIWKTEDDGQNWESLDDYLPALGVSGICISPTNPDLIYVLTGCGDGMGALSSAGVFKSEDGGITWNETGVLTTSSYNGYMLEMDPNDDQSLLAATNIGVFRTTNGGDDWSYTFAATTYDVKYKPGSSDTVYTCTNQGSFYNYNGGASFSWFPAVFDFAPVSGGRKALTLSEADPETVYLFTGGTIDSLTFSGFYKSTDGGKNFQRQANSPNIIASGFGANNDQSFYDFCVAAHPDDPEFVATGAFVVNNTTDGGVTWAPLTGYGNNNNPEYVHPDIHALGFNPLNNNLYCANDGGFYKSSNNGVNWSNLSEGISTTQFYHMGCVENNLNPIIGGCQDNGVKLRYSNSSKMDHISGADGFSTKFDPNDISTVYASVNEGLSRFDNNGQDWVPISPKSHWFMEFETHNSIANLIFAGTNGGGGRLYKSLNKGASWDTLYYSAGQSIAMCPSNFNRIYLAGNVNQLHRTDNLGTSFIKLDDKPGFPNTSVAISDVTVEADQSAQVYVSFSGFDALNKVFKSTDSGGTWTNITGGLPNIPVLCLTATTNGDLYAGTELGVFYRKDGDEWIPFRNGLPAVRITDLFLYPNNFLIRASTYGRGIWTGVMAGNECSESVTWNNVTDMEGYNYYEAELFLENRSNIFGGVSTEVLFRAGQYIDLKDGFHVKDDGSYFEAVLGPCNNGIPTGN